MNLNEHYQIYKVGTALNVGSDSTSGLNYTSWGYTCPYCGTWVASGSWHYCEPYTRLGYWQSSPDKTEQAFNVLKMLVKEKIVDELMTFDKFCALIEKIKSAL